MAGFKLLRLFRKSGTQRKKQATDPDLAEDERSRGQIPRRRTLTKKGRGLARGDTADFTPSHARQGAGHDLERGYGEAPPREAAVGPSHVPQVLRDEHEGNLREQFSRAGSDAASPRYGPGSAREPIVMSVSSREGSINSRAEHGIRRILPPGVRPPLGASQGPYPPTGGSREANGHAYSRSKGYPGHARRPSNSEDDSELEYADEADYMPPVPQGEPVWHKSRSGFSYCIIPGGPDVIVQDEDGNEITRIGDFGDKKSGKKHKGPLIIQDEDGNEIYRAELPRRSRRSKRVPSHSSPPKLVYVHPSMTEEQQTSMRAAPSLHVPSMQPSGVHMPPSHYVPTIPLEGHEQFEGDEVGEVIPPEAHSLHPPSIHPAMSHRSMGSRASRREG